MIIICILTFSFIIIKCLIHCLAALYAVSIIYVVSVMISII